MNSSAQLNLRSVIESHLRKEIKYITSDAESIHYKCKEVWCKTINLRLVATETVNLPLFNHAFSYKTNEFSALIQTLFRVCFKYRSGMD